MKYVSTSDLAKAVGVHPNTARRYAARGALSERYLLTLITYIHRNPQKHGFVADFREWPWSSYGAMLADKPTKINRDEVLAWYNGRSNFVEAHIAEPEAELIAPLLMDDWF